MTKKIILFGEDHTDPSCVKFLYHYLSKLDEKNVKVFCEDFNLDLEKSIKLVKADYLTALEDKEKLDLSGNEKLEELKLLLENHYPSLSEKEIVRKAVLIPRLENKKYYLKCAEVLKHCNIKMVNIDLQLSKEHKTTECIAVDWEMKWLKRKEMSVLAINQLIKRDDGYK
ncbi:MAG: hypothetical protein HRK26_05395 [Rickettsiaceae bacterium H1]|nr:hypothetical protein [Rickettsiaceae bacterium H1]